MEDEYKNATIFYKSYPATSSSNNGMTFNVQTPGPHCAMDQKLYVHLAGTFTLNYASVTNNDAGKDELYKMLVAFRSMPLASITDSASVDMNNLKFSSSNVAGIKPAMQYLPKLFNVGEYGQPDNSNNYYGEIYSQFSQLSNIVSLVKNAATNGIFSTNTQTAQGNYVEKGRSGINLLGFRVSNTPLPFVGKTITADYNFDFCEVVPCYPFNHNGERKLAGIDRMQISLAFNRVINMLCTPYPAGIENFNFTKSELMAKYYIPKNMQIESPFTYSCPDIKYFRHPFSALAGPVIAAAAPVAGTVGPITYSYQTSTVNLGMFNTPPEKIIIWVMPEQGEIDRAQIIFPIDSIRINFADRTNLFGECSDIELFKMSTDSGLSKCNYSKFSGEPTYNGFPGANLSEVANGQPAYPISYNNAAPLVIAIRDFLGDVIKPEMTQYAISFTVTYHNNCGAIINNTFPTYDAPAVYVNTALIFDRSLILQRGTAQFKNE